jgi:bifunctional DNA-binding transcriptional regulator/antitoxin component of YhaV-PrlF toxin-antitoxin module
MTVKVKRVAGALTLVIPDELAATAGISEDTEVTLDVVGHMLLIRNAEFIERVRAAEPPFSGPTQVRDPFEPYEPAEVVSREGR